MEIPPTRFSAGKGPSLGFPRKPIEDFPPKSESSTSTKPVRESSAAHQLEPRISAAASIVYVHDYLLIWWILAQCRPCVADITNSFFTFFYVSTTGILQEGSHVGTAFISFHFGLLGFQIPFFWVFWALISFLFGFLGQDGFVSIYVPEGYR